jgi:hypothetical protein
MLLTKTNGFSLGRTMDLITVATIDTRILVVRGQRIMLDSDLAEVYGVETKRLIEQVKQNLERFPEDFMFRLTSEEYNNLRSQTATSSQHGGRRYSPYAFTEHGALMLAGVLRSERAVIMSIYVVRAVYPSPGNALHP